MSKTIWSRLLVATIWTAFIAALLIPAALTERGYWAFGGEWLLIVVSFISVMLFSGERKWH